MVTAIHVQNDLNDQLFLELALKTRIVIKNTHYLKEQRNETNGFRL